MRRAFAALAAAAIGMLTLGAAPATAQPSGRAAAGELTLVSQDTVSTTPGNTVTFTVAVPANVELAALAPDAQVIVTGHEAIERSEPGGELLDTRGRLAAAIAGRLPPVTQETGIPVVNLAQPAAGQLAIPIVVDGDGTSATPLALGGPGIHPVRLRLESAGQDIGDVLTFVQVTDPATIHAPLAVAVAVGTDAAVHLDDQLQVVLDDATVAELTKLADVLEASATPITVHVEPALLAALRGSQPALADRFAAVLEEATVMSAPDLPLDVSAAAAADQGPLYTQWLAAGEDLFGTGDLPGTTLRAATAVTTPLSEPGGELLRDLGTRLLLLPPDIYDSLGGSILGYTDTSQLVRVRLSDDRSFDAAIVDRTIGRRLATPSDQPYLDAVYTTVDLLADRQGFIDRQLDPARRTVLIGTSDLGLPDPAVLGPLTQLITSTAGLSVSSVSQLGASTDTMVYDGGPLTVDLPATTDASIAERIAVRDDLAARADQTRTMLTADNPLPSHWQSQLDVLPSSAVSDSQVVAIQQQMMGDFAVVRGSVEPPRGLDFTMTGRTGTLRLKLRNTADYPVNVRVRLGAASNKLTFPPENVYQLAPHDTTELHFEIKARANGRFPVYLTLLAPGDTATVANPLSRTRFTATVFGFSGLGNLVTGAALLILLTWWVHHIRNSRRRKAAEAAMRRHPVGAGMPASSSVPDP